MISCRSLLALLSQIGAAPIPSMRMGKSRLMTQKDLMRMRERNSRSMMRYSLFMSVSTAEGLTDGAEEDLVHGGELALEAAQIELCREARHELTQGEALGI